MVQVQKAKVFWIGRSQAVRIPQEYRFKTDEVFVRHDPATGDLTFSEKQSRDSLEDIFAELDAAGAADFVLKRDNEPPIERVSLPAARRV